MKTGTILGVLGAAAAVAAIAIAAPARSAENPPGHTFNGAVTDCGAYCDTDSADQELIDGARTSGVVPEPSAWLLMLTGIIALGGMFRAARPAFSD
ncbi:PEP-CTERM sorting domain-containing protein [Phenylobacterium sp.]|uniref:PEP-CTERM sorting domain-containing protein n=1 Tax=Phenylobacterium sp. TaxID=1871053 RepID=UPI0025DE7BB9|nr:PEP-CTERM sorting domain-containing protein [Phenylobacterium sp.]